MEPILIISGVIIVAIFTVFGIIRANLKICQPNEVLIFSGRPRTLPDGSTVAIDEGDGELAMTVGAG